MPRSGRADFLTLRTLLLNPMVDNPLNFQYFETMDDTSENTETKDLGGRPSKYCDKLRDNICAKLADGLSLRTICRDDAMPSRPTIARWVYENMGEEKDGEEIKVQGFYYHYTRARDVGLDVMADDILDIADESEDDWIEIKGKDGKTKKVVDKEAIARSRLRCDKRQWYLGKMAPKRYGTEKIIKHQQLDKEGEKTDPVGPQINVYAQEIADSVHAEMEKASKAVKAINDAENPA